MSPLTFLQDLVSRGVVVIPCNGKLLVNAPAGVLTAEDRTMLARHKAELLVLLALPTAPDDLPRDWHLVWDERAAVMEYDGGLPRERAEALALAEILRQMQQVADRYASSKS